MDLAGYSGTALIKKLGIKPGMKVLLMHPPANYFEMLEVDISKQLVGAKDIPDLVHLFAENQAVFIKGMKKVSALSKENTAMIVWVSWYKKNSGVTTDLSENMIRDHALQHDLVDIKVCAVSNDWSGLKLVVPVAKR